MKLATFLAPGRDTQLAGEIEHEQAHAFMSATTVQAVLAGRDVPERTGESWPLDQVTLLAPVPEPGSIYGIGLNYAKHVAETGATPPEAPIVFVKVRGAVAPPGGPIRCPEVARRLDYEGELVIVMGAAARSEAGRSPMT